jgi:hypothetical protein
MANPAVTTGRIPANPAVSVKSLTAKLARRPARVRGQHRCDLADTPRSTLAERIHELRRELLLLEQEQRAALRARIAATIPPGVAFSARELFDHRVINPAWSHALTEAGITSARQLGKRLRQLGLTRVGVDEHGAIWLCPS